MHNEDIEEDNEVGDVEEIGRVEEVRAVTMVVLHLDTMLAQQTTSFLKGLDDLGVLQSMQVHVTPLVARFTPKIGGNEDFMICSILCWVPL